MLRVLPCEVTYSLILEIKTWMSLGFLLCLLYHVKKFRLSVQNREKLLKSFRSGMNDQLCILKISLLMISGNQIRKKLLSSKRVKMFV